MEAKRKFFATKMKDQVRDLQNMIKLNIRSIENIKSTMSAGKDLEFYNIRISTTESSIKTAQEKVVELKAKIDLVMTGGLDTEINELYEKTEQTLKEKKEETEKKTKLMKEYEESSMKIGKVFYSSEKDEERRTFNNERYMGKQYDRFLDISGTLPDYISRNLETMPNNKGYKWRGATFFGKLPDEKGPVVVFEKKPDGMIITETTATSEVVWFKGRDNQQKKLVSSKKRTINYSMYTYRGSAIVA